MDSEISFKIKGHAGAGWWCEETTDKERVLRVMSTRLKDRTGAGEVLIDVQCSELPSPEGDRGNDAQQA